MQYVFNYTLLRTLPTVLNMTPLAMSDYVTDMAYYTIVRAVKEGDMNLVKFVALCNGLHLDYRYFFSTEEGYVPKEKLVVPDKMWTPIVFHGEQIQYSKKIHAIRCSSFALLLNQRNYSLANLFEGGRTEVATDNKEEEVAVNSHRQYANRSSKAQYNSLLFEQLPKLVGRTVTSITSAIGKNVIIFTWASQHKNVRVRTLVEICNHLHIGIDKFFCYSDTLYIPSSLITPSEQWEPVIFHPERLTDFLLDTKNNQGIVSLTKMLGCYYQKFQRMICEDSPMTVKDLLEYSHKLGCSPMYFFDAKVDTNDAHAVAHMQMRIKELEDKVQRLSAEKNTVESRLRHANAMLDMKKN